MSSRTSFVESSVSKNKKITWIIDLSKKESVQKKTPVKPVPLAPPKTLYEFMQRHIEEVASKKTNKASHHEDPKSFSKILQKLSKKMMKTKKVHLSELANEVINVYG